MYQLLEENDQVIVLDGHSELSSGTKIHAQSRFWEHYQQFLAEGNTPIPLKPSEFHNLTGNKWQIDLAAAKAAKITEVKSAGGRQIEAAYPLYKQMNIDRLAQGYTQADKDAMIDFIDTVRSKCERIEMSINAVSATDIDPLATIERAMAGQV